MNVDTGKMSEYSQFLLESSRRIVALCSAIEEQLVLAVQCMDQQSGRNAAMRMAQNLENVKNNVPISDDASERLERSRKLINDATNVFGGR